MRGLLWRPGSESRAGVPRLSLIGAVRREPWVVGLVCVIALLDSVERVVRYVTFQSGLDLSIFDQAIWHYSQFQGPYSTIKGSNLLGDHFHPLIAVFAPLYWVWSDPRLLLIASSILVACSVVPVFLFARRRLPWLPAYLIAVAYGLFWGLQEGLGFDFHESDLGPLLIALAVLFADQRRWGWFYLVTALTLGVKEDLSLFVVFLGLYLLTRGERRRGAMLVLVGIVWFELTTHVLIPALAPKGLYAYWSYGELGKNLPSAILTLVEHPWRLFTITFSPGEKAHTLLYLFAPFLFLSLVSREFLLAIPLLAERFLSTRTAFWGTSFHFSLTVAPILAMGGAAGLANVARWARDPRVHRRLRARGPTSGFTVASNRGLRLAAAGMAVVSLVLTLTISDSPLRQLLKPSFYKSPSWAPAAERAMAHVPPGAPVTANDILLTHLMHRQFAGEIAIGWGLPGYLIANLGEPVGAYTGNTNVAQLGSVLTGKLVQTTPIYYDHDWIVAKLPPPGQKPTNGAIAPLPLAVAKPLLDLAYRWHAASARAITATTGCYDNLIRGQAGASGCFQTTATAFQRAQRTMTTALAAAQQSAAGPCATLAGQAYEAIDQIGSRQISVDLAGEQNARQPLLRAAAVLSDELYQRDLPGRMDHFLALCYPRSARH
jgi:uncharacterized membrane protein